MGVILLCDFFYVIIIISLIQKQLDSSNIIARYGHMESSHIRSSPLISLLKVYLQVAQGIMWTSGQNSFVQGKNFLLTCSELHIYNSLDDLLKHGRIFRAKSQNKAAGFVWNREKERDLPPILAILLGHPAD